MYIEISVIIEAGMGGRIVMMPPELEAALTQNRLAAAPVDHKGSSRATNSAAPADHKRTPMSLIKRRQRFETRRYPSPAPPAKVIAPAAGKTHRARMAKVIACSQSNSQPNSQPPRPAKARRHPSDFLSLLPGPR